MADPLLHVAKLKYPAARYAHGEQPKLVNSEEEDRALGEGWYEHPDLASTSDSPKALKAKEDAAKAVAAAKKAEEDAAEAKAKAEADERAKAEANAKAAEAEAKRVAEVKAAEAQRAAAAAAKSPKASAA
jgi:hypothetical protein